MSRHEPIPWIPRGLNREQSAHYVGVGATKFDQMVGDGRMPGGKKIDGRVVWDRFELDEYFARLPDKDGAARGGAAPDPWGDVRA